MNIILRAINFIAEAIILVFVLIYGLSGIFQGLSSTQDQYWAIIVVIVALITFRKNKKSLIGKWHAKIEKKNGENTLFNTAKDLVIEEGYASPALLQRKLKIDYLKASYLMTSLEKENIIELANGAKPRKIKPVYSRVPFPFNFE
jgi:DNA segregation ATPase FtsK/SpoIIIE-like protein